jgi:tripartite-type tricarboxylate transporter receptor subunit TctC
VSRAMSTWGCSGVAATTMSGYDHKGLSMAGIDMTHVRYRGGAPAITALLGGQVQVYFSPLPEPIEYVKVGKLRALAVTTATRIDTLPDVPTMGEFVPGYELSGWQGIVAPKGTPAAIIDRLNREINATLSESKMTKRLANLGVTALQSSSAEFGKFIADETSKYGNVIRAAGIRME